MAVADRQVHSDGSVLITGAGIQFRVQALKPGHVLLTVHGGRSKHDEDAAAERLMLDELSAEMRRSGPIVIFADMRGSSSMGAQSRDVATEWLHRHKRDILASHVLVRSKLIEMAMSIVAMVVGGGLLHVYSSVPAFLAVVRGAVPGFLDLPTLTHVAA